jgi:hypothetical protein
LPILCANPVEIRALSLFFEQIVDETTGIQDMAINRSGKCLLLVLVVGGFVVPMLVTGPDGQPIMKPADWLPDFKRSSGSIDGVPTVGRSPATSGKLYKWQDENDRWHFSAEPPAELSSGKGSIEASTMPELENVIPAPSGEGAGGSNIGLSLEHAKKWVESFNGKAEQSK